MLKPFLFYFYFIILSTPFLCNISIQEKTILGKVVAITDGDTFKLLTKDSTLIKVRVANIDCPERKQPFSAKAKQFTSDVIFSKNVKLEHLKKDRYGRFICNVIYNDSLNLSHELIKQGLAWHYVKYSKDKHLQDLENEAKSNKIGLWQDKNVVPPWEWRENKKKKVKE
ncbi:thermonuclease family protein [Jejuia spongiicola]|uniref:Thermonuclease family protein n=1 Tax=Jejuia spongiicola TaxID=2942207 RepID=A0ABT0QGZ4_9FLAO|nr:thermonuclease family protein [Jejuia spongiicola]MCL6296267.1 thermonuclease family protein [Jejuia spongiicola]